MDVLVLLNEMKSFQIMVENDKIIMPTSLFIGMPKVFWNILKLFFLLRLSKIFKIVNVAVLGILVNIIKSSLWSTCNFLVKLKEWPYISNCCDMSSFICTEIQGIITDTLIKSILNGSLLNWVAIFQKFYDRKKVSIFQNWYVFKISIQTKLIRNNT